MAQNQPAELLSTATSEEMLDDSASRSSRAGRRTKEQLVYMNSYWTSYLHNQSAGTLDRFWPLVYDGWYKTWPIETPTPANIKECGSVSAAKLLLHSENNLRIRTWFHNKGRPGSKAAKSDLHLHKNDKRKLAPAQAYCTYAWDSGLREIVIARWEEEKQPRMSDDGKPAAKSVMTAGSSSHIPIDFKLKVAKDVYNSLSPEERQKVDDRRDAERLKLYRTIPEITDTEERRKKLVEHQKNQPSVLKSVLRVLKNLEDQAGCVAQLFVGYVDPESGVMSCQDFCHGKTESGLDFNFFCGDEWIRMNQRFADWASEAFGDQDSSRRSTFMLSSESSGGQEASPSSVEGASQPARTSAVNPPPEINTTTVNEEEIANASNVTPPQPFETTQTIPPETPIRVDNQPPTTIFRSPSGDPGSSMPPQVPETPQFVTPEQIFAPSSIEPNNDTIVVPQTIATPLATTFPVLEFPQTVALHQVTVYPTSPEPHLVASSLTLGTPKAVIPHQTIVIPESPLVTPHPVLEFSQTVVPHQPVISPEHRASDPPQVNHDPQSITRHPSDPTKEITNDNLGVAAEGGYKLRGQAVTTATRSRRDSVEGAPDITLTLGVSGYEIVACPSQPDISTPLSITPSSTAPPLGELIVPSPEQLPEELTIPEDVEMNPPDISLTGELPSQQSLDEPSTPAVSETVITTSKKFYFTPRVIPNCVVDRSDFPSWLLESRRLDCVLSVEAGDLWKKLITTWLMQERRLGFGLNEKIGSNLSLRQKPDILKDYFKWHHNPSKGDSIVLPAFGDEMTTWWANIQPKWRYKDELSVKGGNDYSYILAGGKKGVFLLILCLAWWDKAHGKDLEREKDRRREATRAAGKDDTTTNFDDLLDHEYKWFNLVNDLIIVLELAQGWPVPGEKTPDAAGGTPTRRKRAAEGGAITISSRKKRKSS